MAVHLVTNDLSTKHRVPLGHPERWQRVTSVIEAIRTSRFDVVELEAPSVNFDLLHSVHDPTYVEQLRDFCVGGGGALDADTYAVPASWDAALHAAGAGPAAVDRLAKRNGTAFVAVRPPGHHAERDHAMGFCLFNNIAITATYLRQMGERVAIVDWDVHHGNGTQNSFYEDPDVLYVSIHQFPFYPGTGWIDEVGAGAGRGTTVNIPLPGGTSAGSYLAAFDQLAMPPIRQFAPTWILVSSGYDAHVLDPLGQLNLESEHYGWMAGALASVVEPNRIISFLEGGYNLSALETGSVCTIGGFEGSPSEPVWPSEITGPASTAVALARDTIGRFWDVS